MNCWIKIDTKRKIETTPELNRFYADELIFSDIKFLTDEEVGEYQHLYHRVSDWFYFQYTLNKNLIHCIDISYDADIDGYDFPKMLRDFIRKEKLKYIENL